MSGRVIMVINPEDINYKEIGFKAGLEIHHQLKSERKLFCHCPANLDEDLQKKPQYTFHRRFRAVMGEMGDFDPGMLVEVEKGYLVIYHANDEHVCTYEMDETPPFWADDHTIDLGYHIAALFNCESPVEQIVVNRKQYLDGSITTGFQRAVIVARDGYVELKSGKKVAIPNILIEEDAARKIKTEDRGRTVYYNLDRLGVPLTEIITDHNDVENPEELIETAEMIGLNLRTTDFAMRGIGSVRQDVNISISGGNRVEIKGIQDLGMLPKWCALEVCRQQSLIGIESILKSRSVEKDDFEHTYVDISHLFDDLGEGKSAYAVRLPSFEDILLKEVQPGKDFGYEIFEKCNLITGLQYDEMFHSGECSTESTRKGSRPEELFIDDADKEVRKLIRLAEGDGYVAAKGPTKAVLHTLKKTVERCKQAFDGVPQETRRALANGNSEFLRVIHGKERLYPDTDTPPLPYPLEKYELIKNQINPRPIKLMKKYESGNLNWPQLTNIIRAERLGLFDRMVDEGISVQLTYHLIHDLLKRMEREGLDISNLSDEILIDVGSEVTKGNLNRGALPDLLRELCKRKTISEQKESIETEKSALITDDRLRSIVMQHLESLKNTNDKLERNAIIGSLMKKHGRNLNGKALATILEEIL
jgi:glutamyl-tRNA(Gln) amidotransferase subunit E